MKKDQVQNFVEIIIGKISFNKSEYNIEIIAKNLSWEDAIELEMFLIELYGRRDNKTGILCNMTDGGEGTIGRKMLETTREKIRSKCIGVSRNLGKKMLQETKNKISLSQLNKPLLNSRKKIINIETNEVYDSILDVLKVCNISKTCFYSYLNNNRKNLSKYRYL